MTTVRIVGRGRAGGSFAAALRGVGWEVDLLAGGDPEVDHAGTGADLVLLCVPDSAVVEVARRVAATDAVVAHVSGALGLDALEPHRRTGSIHPLVSMPSVEIGAARLGAHASFAVAGDPVVRTLAEALGGRVIEVADEDRVAYHAAAVVASNHLVGLLGQVERIAATIGLTLEDYLDLVRGTVDNVARVGVRSALTGPAARGDLDTLRRHREVLDPSELAAYDALSDACRRLARGGNP